MRLRVAMPVHPHFRDFAVFRLAEHRPAGVHPVAGAAAAIGAAELGGEPGPRLVQLARAKRDLRLVQGDVLPVVADGIDAIRDYWKDVPLNQAEVTFRSGELYEAGPWFATEFRCTYRRRRTGDWVDARGAMFCETKDGKVTEMRMYWHRYP